MPLQTGTKDQLKGHALEFCFQDRLNEIAFPNGCNPVTSMVDHDFTSESLW